MPAELGPYMAFNADNYTLLFDISGEQNRLEHISGLQFFGCEKDGGNI